MKPGSALPLAQRLRGGALSLGDAFAFMSGLYFRGKITYARHFGSAPLGVSPVWIITPTRGLLEPDTPVTSELLDEFASVDLSDADERYWMPLSRDAAALADALPSHARLVLLGSIATGKYVDVLAGAFGDRLHYPSTFVGRGDMSRGGLLLRSVTAGTELEYVVVRPDQARRGRRPPKLDPIEGAAGPGRSRSGV